MAISEIASPALNLFGDTLGPIASKYWWVLFVFVGIAVAVGGVMIYSLMKRRKEQWTHKLIVRRVLKNNLLSKPTIIDMRRFPLIKRAEVFELKDPLLGGYLMPELEEYSDVNEFSIILDKNNRIYTNRGEYFQPDKSSVNVSAKHAEIDIARADLRADYQNINKTNKRIEWATIAKYALWGILIISIMIVSIVAIGEWGDSKSADAQASQAEAQAMASLAESLKTNEAIVNSQHLLADKFKELFGTQNLQGTIQSSNGNV